MADGYGAVTAKVSGVDGEDGRIRYESGYQRRAPRREDSGDSVQ